MRTTTLGWCLLSGLLATGQGQAQDPYADYNRERAFRHFLNSPYSYRTYSSFPPASGYQSVGPFTAQGLNIDPGYINQRITPYGFESYRIKQGFQSYYSSPFVYQYQYAPSVGESYYSPRIPRDVNPFGVYPQPSPAPATGPAPAQAPDDAPPAPGIGPQAPATGTVPRPPAPGIGPQVPAPLPGPSISRWVPRP